MDKIFTNIRGIIAFIVVVLSFAFLFLLLKTKIPTENKDVIQIAAGIILAGLGGVIGYYFGSSKNESDKAKADIALLNSPPPPQTTTQTTITEVKQP